MYSGNVFSWEASDAITERLSFLTDVREHRDASEQRAQVRTDPRRQLEYEVLVGNSISMQEKSALDTFLWGAMQSAVMLPIWTDNQTLGTPAASGQPTVIISTTGYDFDVDQYCCLWADWNSFEVVQIDSLTSGSITLAENLVSTWPVGTQVLPARLARLSQKLSSQRYGDGAGWRVIFDVDEAAYSSNRLPSISPEQYLQTDVYPSDADFSEALPLDLDAEFGIVDAQAGIVALDSAAKIYPQTIFQYADKFFSRTDITTFLAYLHRWGGRRQPFWLSTQEYDFVATAVETGLTGWLTYQANGYPTFQDLSSTTTRNAIAIHYMSRGLIYQMGDEIQRPILDCESLGGGLERIRINLENIGSGDFDKFKVSYLLYCRLENETVEINWYNNCAASVKLMLRELPNYPATS